MVIIVTLWVTSIWWDFWNCVGPRVTRRLSAQKACPESRVAISNEGVRKRLFVYLLLQCGRLAKIVEFSDGIVACFVVIALELCEAWTNERTMEVIFHNMCDTHSLFPQMTWTCRLLLFRLKAWCHLKMGSTWKEHWNKHMALGNAIVWGDRSWKMTIPWTASVSSNGGITSSGWSMCTLHFATSLTKPVFPKRMK